MQFVKRYPKIISLTLVFFTALFIVLVAFRNERHVLTVAFLDVGQGDSVYIEGPNGNQILYDAGAPNGASLRALSSVMPWYDRSIDVAVMSHPDQDHIGGFADILERYHTTIVFESGASSSNGVFDVIEQEIAQQGIKRFVAKRGMRIDLGEGAHADILYPDLDTSTMETNASSIVLRIVYGDTAVLLSGDLPRAEEEHVVDLYGSALHAQVMKLGHHGSKTSSSPRWLVAVHPDVAVISAGLNNRYGLPSQETIAALDALRTPFLETFQTGTITYESDGQKLTRVQ